jgi:two-component system, NtrC family, sensor kinase
MRQPGRSEQPVEGRRANRPKARKVSTAASITDLQRQVANLTRKLEEAGEQQAATADVLKLISGSAFELSQVLQTVVSAAVRLCRADSATIYRNENGEYRWAADHNLASSDLATSDYERIERNVRIRPSTGTLVGRVALNRETVQILDAWTDPLYEVKEDARVGGVRTMLGVPLLREGLPIGVIGLARQKVEPYTEREIALVRTFADQAVIAIENARLLNELRNRTDELSHSLNDLRAAQDRLVQTEKLASLGQLTAGIAHEIKNPLNFVNNFSALSSELADDLKGALMKERLTDKGREEVDELTALLKDNLGKVVQHGKRADSIVKNMLLHSREGSREQRRADINALVNESLNLAYHGARAEKSGFEITLQRDFDSTAGSIELFPQDLTRAILNVISNGFYAATRRKTENGEAGFEPTVLATTKNLGSSVEIRIRDNGPGIPSDILGKIFTPFFTTKPTGEGTGLGLSMSHDIIVKQHGGRIDVASEPGQFTEFIITLPRDHGTVAGQRRE